MANAECCLKDGAKNLCVVKLPPGIMYECEDEHEILINQNAAVYHQSETRRKCFMQGHSEANVTLKNSSRR